MIEDEAVERLREELDADIEEGAFLAKVYAYVSMARQKAEVGSIEEACMEEYASISRRVDRGELQESCSIRCNLRARRLAALLIDESGTLQREALLEAIDCCKRHTYFLAPGGQHDSRRQEHLLKMLTLLAESKQLVNALHSITKPHMNAVADRIIRETLQLPKNCPVTATDTRRAALSALLCPLRQALGSCFATAPAILIQSEQPEQFFADIGELLTTGRLQRTFAGKEYSVPLSSSSGVGDLKRPFLLADDREKAAKELSRQPGLIVAMEMEGGTSGDASFEENSALLYELLLSYLSEKEPYFFQRPVTVEELIKGLLLTHFSLSEEEIDQAKGAPSSFPFAGAIAPRHAPIKKGGGAEAIARFHQQFERSKSAFKALSDNALLRSWEYTLASFAETKSQVTKWNLYASLGLQHEERGGIGESLWRILKIKLEEYNRQVEEHQYEYEQLYQQVKIRENRLRNAASEEEVRWLKIDYRAKAHEMQVVQELRDEASYKARRIAGLYDQLIDAYLSLIPDHFQEVYDADMIDVEVGPYDDSPAGFRLLCKHGRTNSAHWTFITTADQFVESLVTFFTAVERELENSDHFQGLGQLLSEVTTEIVGQIRTREFMETALMRMAKAHGVALIDNPLENIDRVEKKPWVYTSGGNLHTLVSVYFRREDPPTSQTKWVESPQELLVFFIDTIKQMPEAVSRLFIKEPSRSLLIHSPTHAFLFKPGEPLIREAWQEGSFTYTWVRDRLIHPMERAIADIVLNPDAMRYLVKRLLPEVPLNNRHYFKKCFSELNGSMSPTVFRDYILYTMEKERGLQIRGRPLFGAAAIDALLYKELPIFPIYQLKERVERILQQLTAINTRDVRRAGEYVELFSRRVWGESVMGAHQLQQVIKALLLLLTRKSAHPVDYHREIKRAAEREGFSLPRPLTFADSNWVKEDFAFTVNPGSGKWELWRIDPLGSEGAPMVQWEQWLDGSRKSPDWGLFTNPFEYVAG